MRLKEIKPNMVIHCKTEEEANELMLLCDKKGLIWCTGEKASSNTRFSVLSDRTCYRIHEDHVTYDNYAHYVSENYIITEFSDLIIPELSAKEVLEVVRELCVDRGCDDCIFYHNHCPFSKEYGDLDKVIDICTKWREEHPKEEKKELETEWVYVVRIIKVHDNGKKECVHEVDLTKNEQTGQYPFVEDFVMEQLKKYCSEHKGNFFAVYERICRIKE